MRFLAGFVALITTVFLSACASNYHYQSESNPQAWQGKNISALQQQWGSADQILHRRNGTSVYLYTSNSGRNFFNSTSTNFGLASENAFPLRGQGGMKCSTLFITDANGMITATSHAGNNCGGEWAPNKKS